MTENAHTPNTPQTIVTKKRGLGRGLDALFEDTELRTGAPNTEAAGNMAAATSASASVAVPVPQTGGAGTANPAGVQSPANSNPAGTGSAGAAVAGAVSASAGTAGTAPTRGRTTLPITVLRPGVYQPRRNFNDETLHQLAQSIAQHGIIQPLLVRPIPGAPGAYEIIAGERRWRAAQKAQLHDVPVIINDLMTDRDALQIGLIENLQREDLNSIDEALGYQRLMDEFHFTPERLGEMIGKSRSHIVNTVRLLQLPEAVRALVIEGGLSAGHARALIGLPNIDEIAAQVVEKGLSVRATEKLAAAAHAAYGTEGKGARKASGPRAKGKPVVTAETDPHLADFEKRLTDELGLRVRVDLIDGVSGVVKVMFSNLDQLDHIAKKLGSSL